MLRRCVVFLIASILILGTFSSQPAHATILAPTATASLSDGVGGFDKLESAHEVATIVIADITYALVTARIDDSVTIINISDPANPTETAVVTNNDGEFDELDGPTEIATFVNGTNTYALVLSEVDSSVTIINITIPGTPTETAVVKDGVG